MGCVALMESFLRCPGGCADPTACLPTKQSFSWASLRTQLGRSLEKAVRQPNKRGGGGSLPPVCPISDQDTPFHTARFVLLFPSSCTACDMRWAPARQVTARSLRWRNVLVCIDWQISDSVCLDPRHFFQAFTRSTKFVGGFAEAQSDNITWPHTKHICAKHHQVVLQFACQSRVGKRRRNHKRSWTVVGWEASDVRPECWPGSAGKGTLKRFVQFLKKKKKWNAVQQPGRSVKKCELLSIHASGLLYTATDQVHPEAAGKGNFRGPRSFSVVCWWTQSSRTKSTEKSASTWRVFITSFGKWSLPT